MALADNWQFQLIQRVKQMPFSLLHTKPEFDVVRFGQIGNGIGELAGRTELRFAFNRNQPVADIFLCIITALAICQPVMASYPVALSINVA